jgi:hypothetical protein
MTKTRRTTTALSLPLVAAAAACAPAPEPPATAPAAPPATASAAPPTRASAAVAPAAPTASASAAPAAPTASASAFGVIATLPSPIQIAAVEGALVVAGEQSRDAETAAAWLGKANVNPDDNASYDGVPIGVLAGGALRFPRSLFFQAHGRHYSFVTAAGRWPADTTVLITWNDGRAGEAEAFAASEGRGLVPKGKGLGGDVYVGAVTAGSAAYAVATPAMAYPGTFPSFVDLANGRGTRPFAPETSKACFDPDTNRYRQSVAVVPRGFGLTAEGDFLTVGDACEGLGVEVWKSKGGKGSLVKTVPESVAGRSDTPRVVTAKDKGAWILASGSLLRWDGAELTKVAGPPGAPLGEAGAVGPDGALYVASRAGEVLRQGSAGWELLTLPVKAEVGSFAAVGAELYAAAGASLLRLGAKAGAPLVFTAEAPAKPTISRPVKK